MRLRGLKGGGCWCGRKYRQLLCRSLDGNYGARRHAELLCRSQYVNSAPGATRMILKVYMKIFATARSWELPRQRGASLLHTSHILRFALTSVPIHLYTYEYMNQCWILQVAYRAHVCVCIDHRLNAKSPSLVGGFLRSFLLRRRELPIYLSLYYYHCAQA